MHTSTSHIKIVHSEFVYWLGGILYAASSDTCEPIIPWIIKKIIICPFGNKIYRFSLPLAPTEPNETLHEKRTVSLMGGRSSTIPFVSFGCIRCNWRLENVVIAEIKIHALRCINVRKRCAPFSDRSRNRRIKTTTTKIEVKSHTTHSNPFHEMHLHSIFINRSGHFYWIFSIFGILA